MRAPELSEEDDHWPYEILCVGCTATHCTKCYRERPNKYRNRNGRQYFKCAACCSVKVRVFQCFHPDTNCLKCPHPFLAYE